MGMTTFPSKVIEITSRGLALITARLGDVSQIFDEDSAFFLDPYSSSTLTTLFKELADEPHRVYRVATAGQAVSARNFSKAAVANAVEGILGR
jgi:hypothetical protein